MRGGPVKNPKSGFLLHLPQVLHSRDGGTGCARGDYTRRITAGTPKFIDPPSSLSVYYVTQSFDVRSGF
jgi:hypothetical protein